LQTHANTHTYNTNIHTGSVLLHTHTHTHHQLSLVVVGIGRLARMHAISGTVELSAMEVADQSSSAHGNQSDQVTTS